MCSVLCSRGVLSLFDMNGDDFTMTHFNIRTIVAFCLASTSCHTAFSDEVWVKPPSQELRDRTPGLVHETFDSRAMETVVGYSVVLPEGYAEGDKRYPVVYWLHGGGGNECSSLFTADSWRELSASQKIQDVILVYPNGFRSGYMDHHDGQIMVESMFIRELIPLIDKRFRTISRRAGRAVHGFSMGASGALKFAVKYPELFCSAVAYGGGAIDLENTKRKFVLDILQRNLNSDPELIRRNNTYYLLKQKHESVRQADIRFLLICGDEDSWKDTALKFQNELSRWSIPCSLKMVTAVGHDLRKLSAAEGTHAAVFQDEVFRRTLVAEETQ